MKGHAGPRSGVPEPGKAMVKVFNRQVIRGPEGWPGRDKQEMV